MAPWMQYGVILAASVGFFGLAVGTRVGMGLRRTPVALFSIVLLFTPLNLVAMDLLDLFARGGAIGLFCQAMGSA
ncbi:MAG: hypothetical protein HY815_08700, partial [Candidatus Riflebacteria bacterium]|nr:hypothetical protein [Candidatus Riflebacteria bacterium]